MNRRKFLTISGIGISGIFTAMLAFTVTLPGIESLITSILTMDLRTMKVQESEIKKYARDAAILNPYKFDAVKWKFLSVYNRLSPLGLPLPYSPKYQQFRAEIVGNFLLSTGYFWNKMSDEEIHYTGKIYTPYNYPCGNPFSNLYYPAV